MPIYLHFYYQELGYKKSLYPDTEKVYEQIIALPIYPLLKNEEIEYIFNNMINIIFK